MKTQEGETRGQTYVKRGTEECGAIHFLVNCARSPSEHVMRSSTQLRHDDLTRVRPKIIRTSVTVLGSTRSKRTKNLVDGH